MRDEFDGRVWVAQHSDFSASLAEMIDTAISKALVAFERLVAIEFDAPWGRSTTGR